MTIKLERIVNSETNDISYRIRKSFLKNLLLTSEELKELKRLIIRQTGGN